MIEACSIPSQVSRAAGWLVVDTDFTLHEVLDSCEFHYAELSILSPAARAADCLDTLRESPDPHLALALLRTLVVLAPKANAAKSLKIEALRQLERGFATVSPSLVLSLKNLDSGSLPLGELPENALQEWVSQQVTSLPISEASQILAGLKLKQAQIWWQQSVNTALSEGLAIPDAHWAKAALAWLGLSSCADVLRSILPSTENVETRLLDVSSEIKMSEDMLQLLRLQVLERRWSRLHAWSVMKILSPLDAFHAQRQFPDSPLPGLKYLVEHLPGAIVVSEFISIPNSQLTSLVAQRTAQEPELLRALDANHSAWRALWAAHVTAGGICWPPGVNPDLQGYGLLDAVLDGDEPSGLVAVLAKDLAQIAYNHPKRAELWQTLSSSGCQELLPHVADVLIQACNAGQTISTPEHQLAKEVVSEVRKTAPSAKVLASLLSWNVSLDEQEVIRWLSYLAKVDWELSIAAVFGKFIFAKGWKRAAKEIYDRFMLGSMPELRPAVEACQDLLSWWQRARLSFDRAENSTLALDRRENLVRRLAELGADLAPDELEDIWERAGGKRKHLPIGGTPANRWQTAATMANQGSLKNELLDLVRELKGNFPHNQDLFELDTLIDNLRR
jgi:hypothetical protein